MQTIPTIGDTVLTAVGFSKSRQAWVIPISYMPFMPGGKGAALCIIDGPADPRVAETLKRIQGARARGRANAAATNPPAAHQTNKPGK